jgi:hypothetical protein
MTGTANSNNDRALRAFINHQRMLSKDGSSVQQSVARIVMDKYVSMNVAEGAKPTRAQVNGVLADHLDYVAKICAAKAHELRRISDQCGHNRVVFNKEHTLNEMIEGGKH